MKNLFCIILSIFLLISCDVVKSPTNYRNNPYDVNNPEYTPPVVNIIDGPNDGETINVDSVTVRWQGSNNAEEYRFKLNNKDWTPWNDTCSTDLKYLDDGEYLFKVQARVKNSSDKIGQIDSLKFTVNAITGPAIIFYPKYKRVGINKEFNVDLLANEVENLSIFKLIINYSEGLKIDSISLNEEFILQNGGRIIKFIEIKNEDKTASINIGITESNSPEINGSDKIATLHLHNYSKNNKFISFSSESQARDKTNEPIGINFNEMCRIIVKD